MAIKSLEKKLGEPLFNRVGKKLILNERGKYFKENTYAHFLALNDAKNIFQKNKLAGNMKIASSKTISNYLLPDIYFEFISLYPEVTFDIDSYNSTKIIEKVLNGDLDIGFIETNLSHSNIIKKHLYDDELIIVTSDKNYPKEKYIDTIEKRWILRETGSGTKEIFMEALGDFAQDISIFMQLHSFQEIKKIILDNPNTITAISKLAVQQEIKEKKLFEVKLTNISFKREFSLIFHKNKTNNYLFETFVDFLYNKLM